jgi:hypothetical protein
MYFDPEPKEKRRDLYNFEKEYKELRDSIKKGERIIVIKGIRRTGKTSLMKVTYDELKCPRTFMDGRITPPKQNEIFNNLLQNSVVALTDSFIDLKLKDVLKEIAVTPFGIGPIFSFSLGIKSFEKIDKILKRRKSKLVIFVDEAQRLKAGNISGIIAHLFEHTRYITIVLAGSEVGILDSIIGTDAESDLYGRPKKLIELNRLKKAQATEFLKLGFKQYQKEIKESDLERVVETVDGITGWLTLFGYYSNTYGMAKALEMVKKEGGKITAKEMEHFLQFRKEAKGRYLKLLEALSTPLRWVEVKRFLEAQQGKRVNDRIVSKYLHELEKYGLITMDKERKYLLADPMIREGVFLLTRGK